MTLDLATKPAFAALDVGARRPAFLSSDGAAADWVARGFGWFYAFNLEAAVHCFRAAVRLDDACIMGWWGVAFASGPFMNMPWDWFTPAEKTEAVAVCHEAAMTALRLVEAGAGTVQEQALVAALADRYPTPELPAYEADFARWDIAYADAMKGVYQRFGDDPDIAAIFIDSQIMLTPWAIWDVDARAANPVARVDVIYKALSDALAGDGADHLGVLHYDIHVQEMSPTPEAAMVSAHRLGDLAPRDAGHLHHMPAHIHALEGDFGAATRCSHKAVASNQMFKPFLAATPFYRTSLCHDAHMLIYAGMMTGNHADAMAGVAEMQAVLEGAFESRPDTHLKMTLEGYHSTLLHVPVRFGRWDELSESHFEGNPDYLPVSWVMYHYGRAVAFAAKGREGDANQAAEEFAAARRAVPAVHGFFNNPADDILAVGEAMMKGELAYHAARYEEAFEWLELAAMREDSLYYNEPRAWMHPPRHALGALLLEQGHVDRAEAVYRRDLGFDDVLPKSRQNRGNIWSLHGLAECVERRGDPDAGQITVLRDAALALSDQKITSSCFCRQSCQKC